MKQKFFQVHLPCISCLQDNFVEYDGELPERDAQQLSLSKKIRCTIFILF